MLPASLRSNAAFLHERTSEAFAWHSAKSAWRLQSRTDVWWIVTLLALTEPAGSHLPAPALRLATAATSERVDIAPIAGDVALEVVPLDALIRLRMRGNTNVVAARITAAAGQICPSIHAGKDFVELRCRTPQLDATLNREGDHLYLDLHELRGLPWRLGIDGPPLTFFEPSRMGIGGPCPGDRATARAECALHEGRFLDAARFFREALTSADQLLAQMRLGDLALIAGDPQTAVGWYNLGSRVGIFGRMSSARLCEFDPECITLMPTLDPDPYSLPPLLRDDLVVRGARAQAFAGNHYRAVEMLRRRLEAPDDISFCSDLVAPLCRRLILSALRKVDLVQGRKVLEVYLMLPNRAVGPVAVELAGAAAEMAAKLGAPVFGANLLSAVTGEVPAAQLEAHLLRAAELYLMGQDPVRARVIVEFAESKALERQMRVPRWTRVRTLVRKTVAAKPTPGEVLPPRVQDSAAETLATALGLSARIDAFLRGKDDSPLAAATAIPPPTQVPAANRDTSKGKDGDK